MVRSNRPRIPGHSTEARRAEGNNGLGVGEVGCADIDECRDNSFNDCDAEADCINTPGTYSCECRKGFHGTGFFIDAANPGCYNINECDTGRVDCDPNASCVDIEGSGLYRCECNTGYHGPGDKADFQIEANRTALLLYQFEDRPIRSRAQSINLKIHPSVLTMMNVNSELTTVT